MPYETARYCIWLHSDNMDTFPPGDEVSGDSSSCYLKDINITTLA